MKEKSMPDTVVFEDHRNNIEVSAYTDLYAYHPENGAVLFISLAGNEQAVKAISSAIIAGKMLSIGRGGESEDFVHGHPASRYRIMSTKLVGGSLHQIVADTRFYVNSNAESRLVMIPADTQPHEAIYSQILEPLPSPVIPAWSQWIYGRLLQMNRLREMAGTLKVVEARVDDHLVDELVSEGIRMGKINFNEQGGPHVGIH
jgi:hypothetical protein